LEEWRNREESSSCECKVAYSSTFLKTVSAFANYRDGKIYFGIQDDGVVVGLPSLEQVKLQIENAVNDAISPRPIFEVIREELEGKAVIILSVHKGMQTPYYYQHQAYKRSDTFSTPVNSFELQALVLAGTPMEYDELPATENNLSFTFLQEFLERKIHLETFNDDTLRTLGLLTGNGYNRAAQLLADVHALKQASLDIARLGDSVSIFLDRQLIGNCSVLNQYEKAMQLFDLYYKSYEQVTGFYREKRIQIPREAFREVLANSLVHRDYSHTSTIRIAMYPDKIEVTSPGNLPRGISKEEYLSGRVSVPRNAILAEVFHRLAIIERFATGIKRIQEAYKPFSEKPSFEILENSISVTLPKVTYERESKRVYQLEGASNPEQLILEAFEQEKKLSRASVEELSGLSKSGTQKILNVLTKKGLISKQGKGPGTFYRILERE
jgi:ATP-dependent DNA helicase RecG